MLKSSNALYVKPFHSAAVAHLAAGLDERDLPYLTVNPDRSKPETVAEFYQRRTGKPYTGSCGHVSID